MTSGRPSRKQRRFEDSSHKTAGPRPGLRPSPRGGMIYVGGVPGNRGGPGRPITHGRYSRIHHETLRELSAQHQADPDPLNLLPELAMSRALTVDFINRFDTFAEALLAWHESYKTDNPDRPAKPTQVLDISDAWHLLSETTKIVKRIEDIRGRNAIAREDFHRLMQQMADAVAREVETRLGDEDAMAIKSGIAQRWREIRLA